jgi:hypothetical protein
MNINEMTLAECIERLRELPNGTVDDACDAVMLPGVPWIFDVAEELANRIDKLLYEQAQRHDAYVDALENKISALEEKHRWIPVGERLPTKEDALALGEYMGIEFWSNKFGGMKLFCTVEGFNQDFIERNEVTHWQRIDTPEGV